MDTATKDMFMNVDDRLKDALTYLETDCYIKPEDKYFEPALHLYDVIWELTGEIEKLISTGSTQRV